jgi:hypothetical protein
VPCLLLFLFAPLLDVIKSIFLKYIELTVVSGPGNRAAASLSRILKLWRTDTLLMMDEVDLLLHPLKSELNFPIGEKAPYDLSHPDGERWGLPIFLLDYQGGVLVGRLQTCLGHVCIRSAGMRERLESCDCRRLRMPGVAAKPTHDSSLDEILHASAVADPLSVAWAVARNEVDTARGDIRG